MGWVQLTNKKIGDLSNNNKGFQQQKSVLDPFKILHTSPKSEVPREICSESSRWLVAMVNQAVQPHRLSHNHGDIVDFLAWRSVQLIHTVFICFSYPFMVLLPAALSSSSSAATMYNNNANVNVSTPVLHTGETQDVFAQVSNFKGRTRIWAGDKYTGKCA